uniref:Small ribosomal subunit protein bS18c n=1 Tax=Derbesia sp. WEST4838 TaxID=1847751 RepID=A0A1C9JBI9_9CHLO|nr:ribosomal protein S18 [Derbesia sp. WEST4838]AOP19219.1 ribosomal protein S18 [Derbesia sp. WEST4838]
MKKYNPRRRRRRKKRIKVKTKNINYKNITLLRHFISPNGKIIPRRLTKVTAKQQRKLCNSIKRARVVAFLPFISMSSF